MSPIRRNGIFYLYVPRQSGGVALRTTGTTEKRVYTLMKALVARLKAERRWSLLLAVIDGKLTLGQLYDADRVRGLDALEASLSAQGLYQHIVAYLESCVARGLDERNVENIERQLTRFLAWHDLNRAYPTTADLTTANVTAWLASLQTTPGTRRQYLYAVTGFTRYLVDIGVLTDYPLSRVKAPKKNPARMRYEDAATDQRIVSAAMPKYRALFAFVKATGCDLGTALALHRSDVQTGTWTARLRGTKTAQRDVHEALIESWARPYIAAHIGPLLGNAPVFPELTGSGAYHHHEHCCIAVGVEDYTLKDSRHSVGVRMAKAGYTIHEIAEQLGNSPEICARVYTRFIPKMVHRVTTHVTRASGEQP